MIESKPTFLTPKYLIRRYVFALSIIGFLSLLSYLYNHQFSDEIKDEPYTVNQIGRQKVNVLNILITLKTLENAKSDQQKKKLQDELEAFFDDFKKTTGIINEHLWSSDIKRIYEGENGVYAQEQKFLSLLKDFTYGQDWSDEKYLNLVSFGRDHLLQRLEDLANSYQKESERRNLKHNQFEVIINLIIALTLLIEASLIFYPLVQAVKSAIDQLEKEKKLYAKILDSLPDGLYVKSRDHRIILTNNVYTDLLRLHKDKVIGSNEYEIYPNDLAQKFYDQTEETFVNGGTLEHEDIIFPDTQKERHFLTKKTILTVEDSQTELLIAIIRDITNRSLAEINLAKSEQFQRTLLKNAPIGVFRLDRAGRFTYVNDRLLELTSLSEEQVFKGELEKYFFSEDLSLVRGQWESLVKGKGNSKLEYRFRKTSGQIIWIKTMIAEVTDENGIVTEFVGAMTDITELKESQRLLAEAESIALLGNFETDIESNITTLSGQAKTILGLSPEQKAMDINWIKILHPEDQSKVRKTWKNSLKNFTSYEINFRLVREDGAIVYIHSIGKPLQIGSRLKMVGVIQDVTKLKETERALSEAQTLAKIGNYERNFKTKHISYSEQALKILDIENVTDLDGIDWSKRIHPDDFDVVWKKRSEAFLNKESFDLTYRILVNNEFRYIRGIGYPVVSANGEMLRFLGTIQDIHEAKMSELALEEERARSINSSKMASLGEMAGGLAHEINNPTAIILGRIQQLKRAASKELEIPSEVVLESVQKIEQTLSRITKIISGLRRFSRNAENDPLESVSVSQIVEETLELCRERLRLHDVELRVEMPTAPMMIQCRGVQISQVLLNLVNNAYDAVENLNSKKWIEVKVVIINNWLDLIVTDSGEGIDPKIRHKIMDPFFTTKEVGKGTGLGLSISQGILQEHGGSLKLDLNHSHTSFIIRLPYQVTT